MENNIAKIDNNTAQTENNTAKIKNNSTKIENNIAKTENNSPQTHNNSPQTENNPAQTHNNPAITEKNLSELAVGTSGTIKSVLGEGKIRRRLFDMGLTPGTEIFMKKKAPLGDPLELLVRGYSLSLRKIEAASILMEVKF